MGATKISTVLVAMVDQLRRTRIKHTLEQMESVNLVGDSVNQAALLQQCFYRQPNVIVLDLKLDHAQLLELADQIRSRSPNTTIMLIDHECEPAELLHRASRGILAYATSDTESSELESALSSLQTNSIWIGAAVIRLSEKASEMPPQPLDSKSLNLAIMNSLSEREREVLKLLVVGHKNFAIAQALAISPETIKSHMRRIMEKLSVTDRTQLVIKVLQQGAA